MGYVIGMTNEIRNVPSFNDFNRVREKIARRKLSLYRPYPKQQLFHNAGAKYREILFRAGNQQGKCVSYQTLIDLTDGTQKEAGKLYDEGKQFSVFAWDGQQAVEAIVSHAVKKPAEECFRIWFSNGRWMEAAGRHLILTASGAYLTVMHLLKSVPCLPPSTGEHDLLVHVSDVRHWLEKQQDSPGDYPLADHLCDEPLRCGSKFFQVFLPSLNDAQLHNCVLCGLDDLHCKHIHTRLLKSVHPSSQDAIHRNAGHCVESLGDNAYSCAQHMIENTLEFPPLSIEEVARFQSDSEVCQYPLFSPFNDGNQIIAYQSVSVKPIYDFTVPHYANYITAGIVHHNTLAAAAEVAIHATGKYPTWWEGRVFTKAPVIWCGGVTGEVVRDTIQRLLLGGTGSEGTGFIPPDDVVETTPSRGVADLKDTILVRHSTGGTTRIRLKYYEQGREKWQGDTVDLCWLDEEPDEEIYTEALTRTNATKGFIFLTFTPLKGMSEVVRRFLNEVSPDRCDINMTIDDAKHIAPEERQRIINSYPAHEREARINGTPVLGSGRIFPISESAISCDAIPADKVPMHWQVLGGLDFGWDHPTAAVRVIYDPENDVIYVTNTYRQKEATPLIHAASLKTWGDMYFAWPHDGLQHDKGSGVPLAQIYKNQGLKLLAEHALFADGSNSVEAGIAEMLIRMETGRLKIYKHLMDFFDEFRLYHRRDGKIFKEHDDILCALRYCIVSIRFADFLFKQPKQLSSGQHQTKYDACSLAHIREVCGASKKSDGYDPWGRRH